MRLLLRMVFSVHSVFLSPARAQDFQRALAKRLLTGAADSKGSLTLLSSTIDELGALACLRLHPRFLAALFASLARSAFGNQVRNALTAFISSMKNEGKSEDDIYSILRYFSLSTSRIVSLVLTFFPALICLRLWLIPTFRSQRRLTFSHP